MAQSDCNVLLRGAKQVLDEETATVRECCCQQCVYVYIPPSSASLTFALPPTAGGPRVYE